MVMNKRPLARARDAAGLHSRAEVLPGDQSLIVEIFGIDAVFKIDMHHLKTLVTRARNSNARKSQSGPVVCYAGEKD